MRSCAKDTTQPPEKENSTEAFKVPVPIPSWDDDTEFDSSLNCLGVVHVRIIAAQRLPCPVGSSVSASVSLPPWQGRVRTKRTEAFLSSFDHGVCVLWDRTSNDGMCSMINAWNSDESPVPEIKIDLNFSPLGIGLLDFCMTTLVLPCHVIMKSPHQWRQQWCQAETFESKNGNSSGDDFVLIHLEAVFVPGPATPDSPPPQLCSDVSSSRTTVVRAEAFQRQEKVFGGIEESSEDISFRNIDKAFDPEIPTDSIEPQLTPNVHRPHLLRLESFWVPSRCGVCSKVLFGRHKGFQCEECMIECCRDCHLHVDLQMPCGSDAALIAVASSEHGKLSIHNILSVVAPDESFQRSKDSKLEGKSVLSEKESFDTTSGIGSLKLKFIKAAIFKESVPNDADPDVVFAESANARLCRGEYYARVSISNSDKTGRTPTIQKSGMPIFGSVDTMQFSVKDYGQEFRLDVVDANTDKPVGSNVLTTQGMLQVQRDLHVQHQGVSLLEVLRGPTQFKGQRLMKLELRTGVKHGFGPAFFDASRNNREKEQGPSGIIGWVEVEAGLEEHVQKLYKTGFECPRRPPKELNMVYFQGQLNRVKSLVDDVTALFDDARYILSWENGGVTACALYFFITICLKFDSEYWGSLPLLLLLLRMLYLSTGRKNGARKIRLIGREAAARRQEEEGKVDYILHRPVGTIDVNVTSGSALLSRDGIPGRTSCHVFWDPLRFATKKSKQAIAVVDKGSKAQHEVGYTNTRYSADPKWEIRESLENQRLNHLLPVDGDSFAPRSTTTREGLCFPILQPLSLKSERKDAQGRFIDAKLASWSSSPAAVVFQVRFSDLVFGLGFEYILGEIAVPFSKIVEEGIVSGWFDVSNKPEIVSLRPAQEKGDEDDVATSPDAVRDLHNKTSPSLFVAIRWNPPSDQHRKPDDWNRELSVAVQEEYIRSSKQTKFDLVGTSVGAMNTALGIGGNLQDVQNSLSAVLDIVESLVNLFNFSDPFKSSCLFCSVTVIWVLLIMVPSRLIVLSTGLAHFLSTFNKKYAIAEKFAAKRVNAESESSPVSLDIDNEGQDEKSGSLAIWIINALRSLPTSEDLRKTYFWESLRKGSKAAEKRMAQKRESRLKQLWKAQWYSEVSLRVWDEAEQLPSWRSAFSVVQGHNFLWWRNIRAFDNGEPPDGRLFLSGHAGLTGPSPVEARDLKEELGLFVGIFGRGLDGQERLALVIPDRVRKEALEAAVLRVMAKDD